VRFWQGGLAARAAAQQGRTPIYMGLVLDLSAGGLSARLPSCLMALQTGHVVGLELELKDGSPPLLTDAQFRQSRMDQTGLIVGMQMMGLTEAPGGKEALERIAKLVRGRPGSSRQRAAG
jgi:hypothetical protein